MKKLIALALTGAMVFSLAACGSSSSDTAETDTAETATSAAEEASASEEEAADTSAEAEETSAETEEAADVDYTSAEALTITFNCTNAETESAGMYVTYFKDYLEEITGGNITVNVSYGGTLFGDADQIDACSEGAIDMMIFGHSSHASEVPLLCSVPDFAPDSSQNAVDYFNYVISEGDAGAAITAEAEAYNLKYLSVNGGGANYFLSNLEFENLTDLIDKSSAFGNMAAAKFEELGFTVVAVYPWDYYTAFDTGLMDTSQMDGSALYSMGVYEVAPYWMFDGTFAAGNFMTCNLDWWNGLSETQQAAIQAACDATSEYSVQYNTDAYEALNNDLTANGVTLVEMTEDENAQWWDAIFKATSDSSLATAEENGNVDETKAVLQAAADYIGYDLVLD